MKQYEAADELKKKIEIQSTVNYTVEPLYNG